MIKLRENFRYEVFYSPRRTTYDVLCKKLTTEVMDRCNNNVYDVSARFFTEVILEALDKRI